MDRAWRLSEIRAREAEGSWAGRPLTPEYQAIFEANLKDMAEGGQGTDDPQAVVDHAYHSVDVTTQTKKFLVNAYYGQYPKHSDFVGCSTGGRQA